MNRTYYRDSRGRFTRRPLDWQVYRDTPRHVRIWRAVRRFFGL